MLGLLNLNIKAKTKWLLVLVVKRRHQWCKLSILDEWLPLIIGNELPCENQNFGHSSDSIIPNRENWLVYYWHQANNYTHALSVAPSVWPELCSPNLYPFQVYLEVSRGSSKKDSYKQVGCLWKFSTKSSWLKQLAFNVFFLFHSVNFWLTWVIIIKICWFERGTVERFQSSIKKMEFQFQ